MAFPYTPIYAGAFVPVGNCVTLTAATTPPAAVQVVQTVANSVSFCQYRIFNAGSQLAFVGYGNTALIANTNAVVVSTTANCVPVLPGSLEVLSLPVNTFITAITSTSTSQLYITPGLGI